MSHSAALKYLQAGLSVVPALAGDKRPCIPWKEFQTRRPTECELAAWFRLYPDAGVAIVCGSISGLAVVDCDPRNGAGPTDLAPILPAAPTVASGGGGRHYYFKLPSHAAPI